ncbi:MAG: radical SAM protein [Thermodesulfobacteriota bacterium]|nr:radical SAM protein [Thermodesulfobacteriota bacterium]
MDEKTYLKPKKSGRLKIALVHPNTYRVGMSNLGIHTLYRGFNRHPDIQCERFFLDHNRSIESKERLTNFHIIAFSISYELDWINMLKILIANSIPVQRASRNSGPIIMAGGPAVTLNPEPMADALDIAFLGDGEDVQHTLFEAFDPAKDYTGFLDRLEGKPGIYLPERTCPEIRGDKMQGFKGPRPIVSRIDPLIEPARTCIITPDTVFKGMFLVETARGCSFSCKFCTARRVYHPFRPVPIDRLAIAFDEARDYGLKLGLVSAALNNHPESKAMFEEISKRSLSIAPPALRPGMINAELLDLLAFSRVKGVTLAPETGSEVLRKAIGKGISNETIIEDIRTLVASGIYDIKLYLMTGLPGETLRDIDASIDLIKRIRQVFIKVSKGNKRLGRITVSINTFIPKPGTPFERKPLLEPREAKARIRRITRGLKGVSNITLNHEGPKWAYIQTLLARGDRRVFDIALKMAQTDTGSWQKILRESPLNPDFYTLREIPTGEILPWSFM